MIEQNKKRLKIGLVIVAVLLVGWYIYSEQGGTGFNDSSLPPKSADYGMMDADNLSSSPSQKSAGVARRSLSDSANSLLSATKEDTPSAPETAGDTQNAEKKIIKDGNLTLKVDKVDEAAEKISAIAKANGGEVASSDFYKNKNNAKTGTVTVKVPFAKFENALSEIKKTATEVVRESTGSQDVTEQYTDLQSQLKNKRAEEEAFTKILGGTGKMDDILSVTKELSRVRGEIERLQGQIRYMESQTDMSRITINLSEDPEITATESWRPWQVVKDSINSLVSDAQGFVDFLIVLVIRVIPIIILYLVVIIPLYWIARKIYRKFKKPNKKTITE
ncbi:MAG: DUF4349 domain-containing protein [Candidatus Moranbacteria bacterium]|nr:DUF4349 domain-containing protein [Candidatus Moranbacteria bacterium]